jgi:hypothetical protein
MLSPKQEDTGTKIPVSIHYVQKLFLAQEEFSLLIRLKFSSFYSTNLVNQDSFYLIDSQIIFNRDRISVI